MVVGLESQFFMRSYFSSFVFFLYIIYLSRNKETQKLFHGHYIQDDHEGKDDWQFTLIDQCTTNAELRKREVYWQHRLKTFFPNGLNVREESCL